MHCVTVFQFSSQYILLLLNKFGVTVNFVTVIEYSSQYILLLLNSFGVRVNSLLLSSVLNTHCYCSTDLVLQ